MLELNKVGFAKLCPRERSAPKLVVIIPCFFYLNLVISYLEMTEKYSGLFSI